jgi:hypothetical protein
MTITGGIKFFKRSTALFTNGTTATSDYASASANNILTNRQLVYSVSVGADDDTTTVTWTISYNKTVAIDRIFLNRINFKEFTVQYWSGVIWADFSAVIGLDGSLAGGISETDFADETAYYEFDAINTTSIQITATKTQTADQEKIIYNLFTTEELGTLEYFPQIPVIETTRNPRESEGLGGLMNSQKSYEVVSFNIDFVNYPSQADYDLARTLYNSDDSFLVWLCGGRRGSGYFRYNIEGYGLSHIYNMQTTGKMGQGYPNNIYVNAPEFSIALRNSR